MLAAGLLCILIGAFFASQNLSQQAKAVLRHVLLKFAELLLLLFVAMAYVNAICERCAFEALGAWLIRTGFSHRGLSFCLSPVADNLTTARVICAVVIAVGTRAPRFVTLSCITIVVANANT